jgi:hypothetical protein
MKKKLLLTGLVMGAIAVANQTWAQESPVPFPNLPAPSGTNGPFVLLIATDPTALEGTSTGSFTLIRNGGTNALTVSLGISGSASNGVDYSTIPTNVTIPAGFLAIDIPVSPIVDTNNRGNKTVTLTIQPGTNYQTGGDHRATVTIIDDVFNTPAPTVSISSPTNGSTFAFPAPISITADPSDPGATITSVSFFANDEFLGKVTNSPYTLTWSNAHAGHYALFARAVDNLNQSAVSTPVDITVTTVLPVVAITSPTNGQNFTAHQDIPIDATVTDASSAASIAKVTFYANNHVLGTVTNAPYQIVWSNAPAGFYGLEAAATDNVGQKAYSKTVVINVSRPPQ